MSQLLLVISSEENKKESSNGQFSSEQVNLKNVNESQNLTSDPQNGLKLAKFLK